MTLSDTWSLSEAFAPVTRAQWRARVDQDLKGASFEKRLVTHLYEGIDIQPLYMAEDDPDPLRLDDLPGRDTCRRGASPLGTSRDGWRVQQAHDTPDPADANAAILRDLARGVDAIRLVVATRPNRPGVRINDLAGLRAALDGVWLNGAAVTVDAGPDSLGAAAALVALARERGLADADTRVGVAFDPFAVWASGDAMPGGIDAARDAAAAWAAWRLRNPASPPAPPALCIDASPYHDAGASEALDLAAALSALVASLRALIDLGHTPAQAFAALTVRLRLDARCFVSIARVRALRIMAARVAAAFGAPADARGLHIQAAPALRVFTRRDPWVNLLRNTACVFAAALGGAQVVESAPMDAALGASDRLSRRIARNTSIILQREAHLHRVIDPAGGAWFLEALTDAIADRAWAHFQHLEAQGLTAALLDGSLAASIHAVADARARAIATRKHPIVGVSEFPDLHEAPLPRPAPPATAPLLPPPSPDVAALLGRIATLSDPAARFDAAIDAARAGASFAALSAALIATGSPYTAPHTPLTLRRDADPWEALRDRSDALLARTGRRPQAFLANLGALAQYNPRATFARNLLAAAGFDAIDLGGFDSPDALAAAYPADQTPVAVLCSADPVYDAWGLDAARALRNAGAHTLVLAGRTGDPAQTQAWHDAGLTHAMHLGCDALALMRALWDSAHPDA